MTKVDSEIERLTAAIAAGGQMAALLQALKSREADRERLRRQVASAASAVQRAAGTPTKLRQDLETRFSEWRGVLRRQPVVARQVLKKLLDGPLVFTPAGDHYTFERWVSWAKVLDSVGLPISVASPGGSDGWDSLIFPELAGIAILPRAA